MPSEPLTAACELDPSPQVIVAVKSLGGAPVFSSLNANETSIETFSNAVEGTVNEPASSGASAMSALELAVAWFVGMPIWVIVTVTAYGAPLCSAKAWLPSTEKLPADPVIVPPVALDPSPQSIEAMNAPGARVVSGSVNDATWPENTAPSIPVNETPLAVTVATPTVTVAVRAVTAPPSSWTLT